MIFKSKIDKLISKITKENLLLLLDNLDSEYELQKLYDWQEEYDWIEWVEFKYWTKCDICDSYTSDGCICYAR